MAHCVTGYLVTPNEEEEEKKGEKEDTLILMLANARGNKYWVCCIDLTPVDILSCTLSLTYTVHWALK